MVNPGLRMAVEQDQHGQDAGVAGQQALFQPAIRAMRNRQAVLVGQLLNALESRGVLRRQHHLLAPRRRRPGVARRQTMEASSEPITTPAR